VERTSNIPSYSVLVEADPAFLSEAGDLKLMAGMPAEVYVTGETRTALQYFLEPILQVLRRSMREP
jgi:HlyD family secretion protein